jgi:hypothetical protein
VRRGLPFGRKTGKRQCGGPQTRPFILHPAELRVPDGELVGAAAVHETLLGWRHELNGAG